MISLKSKIWIFSAKIQIAFDVDKSDPCTKISDFFVLGKKCNADRNDRGHLVNGVRH